MKYQVQENCLTIFLPTELDHHNAEEIRKNADSLIEQHQIKCVIFDFADTNFMDSSGIGVIISQRENGVYVNSVMEDSPAQKAGIKEGTVRSRKCPASYQCV